MGDKGLRGKAEPLAGEHLDVVAVDLGTTFSTAAVKTPGGEEMINLGASAAAVPSVMLRRGDRWIFGEVAAERASQDPTSVARNFKGRIGDPVPIRVAGNPIAAEELSAQFLEWVLSVVSERQGRSPGKLVLTHPANWGAHRLDLFSSATRAITHLEPILIPEPLAAAVNHARRDRLQVGQTICVYDLGGGTFDTALLRRTHDGFVPVGRPLGLASFGGVDLDDSLANFVLEHAGIDPAELDHNDPVLAVAFAEFRKQVTRAKRVLSEDTSTAINILLPGISSQVRVTRKEFEDLVRPRLFRTVDVVGQVISQAGLENKDIERVLLVGGSSRIPLIAQMLGENLGLPLVVDADPKHTVALGAALLGAGLDLRVPPRPSVPPLPEGPVPDTLTPDTRTPDISVPSSNVATPSSNMIETARASPPQQVVKNPAKNRPWRQPLFMAGAALGAIAVLGGTVWVLSRDSTESVATSIPIAASTTDPADTASTSTPFKAPWRLSASVPVDILPISRLEVDGHLWIGTVGGGLNVIDPVQREVVDRTALGGSPASLTRVGSTVWSTNASDGTVSIINIASHEVETTLEVGKLPISALKTSSHVLIANSGSNFVSAVGVISHEVEKTIEVGDGPVALIEHKGLIYVVNERSSSVSVIDSTTLTVRETILVGEKPIYLTVVQDDVWVTSELGGTVSVLDTENLRVSSTYDLGGQPWIPLHIGNSVWVMNRHSSVVHVVDLGGGTISRIEVGDEPADMIEIDGEVLVSSQADGTVTIINIESLKVTDTIAVGKQAWFITTVDDTAWIIDGLDGEVHALDH